MKIRFLNITIPSIALSQGFIQAFWLGGGGNWCHLFISLKLFCKHRTRLFSVHIFRREDLLFAGEDLLSRGQGLLK